jgi:multidrug resistance efflux pump
MRFDVKPVGDKAGLDRRHSADVKLWNTPTSTAQKTATPAKNNANTTAQQDAKKKADALIATNKVKAKQALDDSNKAKAIQAQKVLDQAKLTKNKQAIDDAQKKLNNVNKATKVQNSVAPKQKVLKSGFTIVGLIITVIFFKYGFDI